MLTYSFAVYPWLTDIDKIDGKDARLSDKEAMILCYFHSFYRKGRAIHPSKMQIAQALLLRVENGTQPSSIRRALKGLQDKGYIHVVEKGNSKGKANRYEFCPGRTLWDLFQIVDKENPDAFSDKERKLAARSLPQVHTDDGNASQVHTEPIKAERVSRSSATSKAEGLSVTPCSVVPERVPEKAGESDGKKQKVDAHGWKVLTPEEIKENKNRVWKEKYRDLLERIKSGNMDRRNFLVYVPDIIKELRGEEAEKCLKGEEVINQDKWFNPPDDVLDFINGLADQGVIVAIAGYWDCIARRCSNLGETKFNLRVEEENLGNGIYIAHYHRGQK